MSKSNYIDIKTIKKHAKELRRNVTNSEKELWEQLRNRLLLGYKFLHQHPIIYKAYYTRIKLLYSRFIL